MSAELEQDFLKQLKEQNVDVHVFLVSGIKLVGKIGSFDEKTLLLSNTTSQLIYKSAVSTIVPQIQLDYSKLS